MEYINTCCLEARGEEDGEPQIYEPAKIGPFSFFFGGWGALKKQKILMAALFLQQNYITSFGKLRFVSLGGIARDISRHDSFLVVDVFFEQRFWFDQFSLRLQNRILGLCERIAV